MTTANLIKHAACLMAGVLLFAFGASRALSGPAQQIAKAHRDRAVQVVTVDQ